MLYLVIILFLLIFGFMSFYIIYKTNKSYLIQKISNKKVRVSIILFEVLIVLIFMLINMVNTMIVIIHLFIFLIILDLIILIIKKIIKKDIKYNISLVLSILFTTIYFIYGYYLENNIIETKYNIFTNKSIEDFRIVQVSDSHLSTTINGDDFIKYMERINDLNPDIVVITGDFIDDDTSYEDMVKGCKGLGLLKTKYGVYFVYGNHDKGYFNKRSYNNEDLRKELFKNNVVILEDDIVDITDNIVLIGRQDHQVSNRLSMEELTKNIDKNKYIITLDHQPRDFENQSKSNVDLVLSGHTHGGQFIPVGQLSVLLGINDGYYGLSKINNTNFIISSGISNWAFKFKTGTISEYVVIDIKNSI